MIAWLQRLLERLLPRKRPGTDTTDPIPLERQVVGSIDWHQRHAGRTVADLLERKARHEIPPPRRPN